MHIQDSIHVIKVGETVPPAEPSCMLHDIDLKFISDMNELQSHFADGVGQITTGHLQGALAAGKVVKLL